jgi:hypothetical protein
MPSIMPVHDLHLLLPFALPSAADAAIALHGLESAALDKLLARATLEERVVGEDFQRTLPHERWIARRFNAVTPADQRYADDAPLAPFMLLADGGTPGDASWACIEPVHVRIAHDHLVLIDPDTLGVHTEEARALFQTARPVIEALGVTLQAPTPLRWYVSGEALGSLAGASPLRATGRNIEIWLPHEARTGERSRAWMKLQNEVQMAWFEHPLNVEREARGAQGATLVELNPFSAPFIEQDWARWNASLKELEAAWFAPALQALTDGSLGRLSLTLCGDTGSVTLSVTRSDLRKFWRRRPVAALFIE